MEENIQNIITILRGLEYQNSLPVRNSMDTKLTASLARKYSTVVNKEVVSDTIDNIAFEKQLELREYPDYKTVIFTDDQLLEMANEINEVLASLPCEYEFVFRLPQSKLHVPSLKLRSNIEILTLGNDAETYDYTPKSIEPKNNRERAAQSLMGAINVSDPMSSLHLSPEDTIMRIRIKGYVGKYGTVQLRMDDPLFLYKVVMGMYIIFRVFQTSGDYYFGNKPFLYHVVKKGTGEVIRGFEGDKHDETIIRRKVFDQSLFYLTDTEKLMNIQESQLDKIHNTMQKVMANDVGGGEIEWARKNQQRIRNSCYWYYESVKVPQNFLKITSAISAFDAIVGSSSDSKEVKADLIAQVVAKTLTEEQTIKNEVIKLYDLRNKIVHGETSVSALSDFTTDGKLAATTIYYCQDALVRYLRNKLNKLNATN